MSVENNEKHKVEQFPSNKLIAQVVIAIVFIVVLQSKLEKMNLMFNRVLDVYQMV